MLNCACWRRKMWSLWCTGVGGVGWGSTIQLFQDRWRLARTKQLDALSALIKIQPKHFVHVRIWRNIAEIHLLVLTLPRLPAELCSGALCAYLCISQNNVLPCKRVQEKTRKSAKNWIGWIEILNLAKKLLFRSYFCALLRLLLLRGSINLHGS